MVQGYSCGKLSGESCLLLEERCLKLTAHNKECDFFRYWRLCTEIEGTVPAISAKVRRGMREPLQSAWKKHAKNSLPGKKDMSARPMEQAVRAALGDELRDLGVDVAERGKKFSVWEAQGQKEVWIVADVHAEKTGCPTTIVSLKTWMGPQQIRDTFGYAYLSKTWLGQKNIRVYRVVFQGLSDTSAGLIEACKPYIDGVFSLCSPPYLDGLMEKLRELYSKPTER